jgi:ribosome maturation factor RimP
VQGPTSTEHGTAHGRVAGLADALAAPLGLTVLETSIDAGRPPVVRVVVDVEVPDHGRLEGDAPAAPVDIDAIATLSRELDAALVTSGAVPADATLEVSSPGVDRPLEDARDFVRNLGRDVEVEVAGGADVDAEDEGVAQERLLRGRIVAVEDGEVVLAVRGDQRRVKLDTIARAAIVLPW